MKRFKLDGLDSYINETLVREDTREHDKRSEQVFRIAKVTT